MSHTRAGFTLVELVVVVALIGIMFGIGTPAMLGYLPGMRADGAARQVLTDLRMARTRAVEKARLVVVKFHVDQAGSAHPGYYVLAYDDNGDNDYTAGVDALIQEVRLADQYTSTAFDSNVYAPALAPADGVALDDGVANAVTFRANGSAAEDGYVYLMPAQDSGGRSDRNRRVVLVGATGNLRIETYDGSWQ